MGLLKNKLIAWRTHRQVYVDYTLLALFVMGPMLLAGYVLTLDMVYTPNIAAPTEVSNAYLRKWLLHILDLVLPSQIVQKLVIFFILVLSGVGMHRLVAGRRQKPEAGEKVGAYLAGILYVINPFTYERWMAGHYLLLAGYALMPWLVRSLFDFARQPNPKHAGRLAIWYTAIAIVSIHMFVLGLIAGAVILAVMALRKHANKKGILRYLGATLILFVLLNFYWLAGVTNGDSSITQTISQFDNRHLEAFTTAAHPTLGLLVNVAGMYGFWLEDFDRYTMPNANMLLWAALFAALAVVIVLGVKVRWRQSRAETAALLAVGIVGFVVATGIHAPLWGGMNHWLVSDVPILKGFREPQKFSALLVLAYCIFAGYGTAWLAGKMRRYNPKWKNLPKAFLLLPIVLVPTMPIGFAGQLKPVDYPPSWYNFNRQLEKEEGNYKVLFLPWHQYMSFDFSPRIIANPAPNFFAKPVIAGDNAEFGDVFRDTYNPTSDYIEQEILAKPLANDMGIRLSEIGVKYVALAHGPDWDDYAYLNTQPQLRKIAEDSSLVVYLNTEYRE